jgi:hypothetical protein
MSLEKVHLRKLLQLFDADQAKRVSLLRADIRAELKKESGLSGGGNDFYVPFWADAKAHIGGEVDLAQQTKRRIGLNDGRERLYPQLRDGFLDWWREEGRTSNESFGLIQHGMSAQYAIEELGSVVKIENAIALTIGNVPRRIIYPYFSEVPILTGQSARLGLWLLMKALPRFPPEALRILDVIRSDAFQLNESDSPGEKEKVAFLRNYKELIALREKLKGEY